MRSRIRLSRLRRLLLVPFCALTVLLPLPGYYHFLHVRSVGGLLEAIPEHFDLRMLPDGAVPYVISKSIEPEFSNGDSWEALLSQVQLGASQWSSVPNSALRLRFAGEAAPESPSSTPHLEVMFQELPPGVIAMGGPVSTESATSDANGSFVPIRRSVVVMSHRLQERPTYSEAFYLTLVHEMGHALGLQHTFTSSVMSTGVTRATTKSNPLGPDDHAGIAALYPGKYFGSDTGTIRGRITAGGESLHFASVTALQPSGIAVSSITLPDGSYAIHGLPPGSYYLYAQAIPPSSQEGLGPGQIVLPRDENGNSIGPGQTFATRFYPSVSSWREAHTILARAGTALDSVDLDVELAGPRSFHGITTYSFPGSFAVNPAVINANGEQRFFVAFGPNLVENGNKLDGLQVESTGAGISEEDVRPYEPAPEFLRVDINLHPFTAMGPKPLLWSRNGETYVQPVGFLLVGGNPPGIEEVNTEAGEDGSQTARLRGNEFGAAYSFLVDGMPVARIDKEEESANEAASLRIPFTSDGRPVRVVALGRDGQSSLFLNAEPLTVNSRVAPATTLHLDRNGIPAGSEVMVRIESDGDSFADGRIGIHFDTPDVVVRRIWRESANTLVANIAAMPGAATETRTLVIRNDLAVVRQGTAIQVLPPDSSMVSVDSAIIDEATGDTAVYPGSFAIARISGDNLPETLSLLLSGRVLVADRIAESNYRFSVPHDLSLGLATLQAEFPGRPSLPVAVEIVSQPPRILEGAVSGIRGEGENQSGTRRVRILVELPGIAAADRLETPLTVRANGALIHSIERSIIEEDGERLELTFAAAAPAQDEAGDGETPSDLSVSIHWNGRSSPPVVLPVP